MRCRLWLQDRQLRRSHIIPEFLYTPLYGATHQMRSVQFDLPYIRFPRKGLTEKLLCGVCETLLGQYETYFSGQWYGAQGLPREVPEGVGPIIKHGLDYTRFKLFHLSILWRASIATLDDFREVALGPHEGRLREMILAGDSGGASDYRLAASVLLRPGSRQVHEGVVGVPAPSRHDGGWMYSSVYGGCIWHCFVSRGMAVGMDVLQQDGKISISVLDVRSVPGVLHGLSRAASARRAPTRPGEAC